MRVYLGLAARKQGAEIPRPVLELARAAIRDSFPVPPETIRAREWHRPGVSLLAWTNEPDDRRQPPMLLEGDNGRVVGVGGYLAAPEEADRLLTAGRLGEAADALGGCFAAFRAADGELAAATTITRVCPVFYAETPDLHVVGSRALLVHMVAQGRIRWDVLALEMMIRQGHFMSDETPYQGVTALPPASSITIAGGRRTISRSDLPQALPAPTRRKDKRAAITALGEALLATIEPLRNAPEPVNLALTGGRDSRLMAALLHAARIPFRATTNGLDDHPDVILARRIAEELGIDHNVIPPKRSQRRDAILVEHPLCRTHEVLRTCEGMCSAFESIVGYLPYSDKPSMSGQSGEILRGGSYLLLAKDLSPRTLRRRLDHTFLRESQLFTEEANEHARALAAPWQAMENPLAAIEQTYVSFKVGRWHAAARTGSLRRGDQITPFHDNHVVRLAMSMDPLWRRSEEVVYELIRMFAPRLLRIPVDGKQWRFLADRPSRPWRRTPPEPLVRPPSKGGWNWRTSPGPELSGVLGEFVLKHADVLAPIVEVDQLRLLFKEPVVTKPQLAWHLYTVAALLTGLFPGPLPGDLGQIRVPVPVEDPA